MTFAGQPTRVAPGRPDERAIADRSPVLEGYTLRRGIDRDGTCAGHHRDVAIDPELRGTDENALERLFAREILLGERRALVGDFGLFADHKNRARELALAERHRSLRAAVACPTI